MGALYSPQQPLEPVDRCEHQLVLHPDDRHGADRSPAEALEEPPLVLLDGGVEAQRAPVLGEGHRGDDQLGTHPGAGVGRDDQAAAARHHPMPPWPAWWCDAHAAEHGTVRGAAGDEHDGVGVLVDVVAVVTDEEPLGLDEDGGAQAPVGEDAAAVRGLDQDRFGRLDARATHGGQEGDRRRRWRGVLGETERGLGDGHGQPPAKDRALHAPQAAQPAPWSVPRISAAARSAATRRVTSASSAGGGAGSWAARVPASGRNGTTNG